MDIDFDPVKNLANLIKHGIDFSALEYFDFDRAHIEQDPRDYQTEARFCAYGLIGHRLYVLIFTLRGDRIRVISLRKANKREVRYAQTRR
jgi:hypothetical protein